MPGPVSDSYDSEFGTSANASDVREAIEKIVGKIGVTLGSGLKNIVQVVHTKDRKILKRLGLTEREMRIIRFGLNRALESI